MLSLCLIEDNEKLGRLTHNGLLDAGYECDRYQSSEKFSEKNFLRYHIFIIDVMLPGEDGFSLAQRIRDMGDAGIIMLTARASLTDKQIGFSSGADDYVTKPFDMNELVMRIEALSTRIQDMHYFIQGDIFIDHKSRIAKKDGSYVHLTPTEREVLRCLLKHKGRVCERTTLLSDVWGGESIYTNSRSLDVTIAHIRSKLGKECIDTVAGIGYKLFTPD